MSAASGRVDVAARFEPDLARTRPRRRARSASARGRASVRGGRGRRARAPRSSPRSETIESGLDRRLRGNGSPKASAMRPSIVRAARTEICWPTTARTASSNPSNVPGTRRPGCAAASGPSAAATTAGSHARSNACFTRDNTAGIAAASDGDTETRSAGFRGARRTSTRPTCVEPRCATATVRAYASRVTGLHAVDRAAAEEREHRVPIVRRPKRELERERRGKRAAAARIAQPPRRHPVARLEQRVEAAHAREPARERDLGHRQRRVGEKPLREQQPLRLRVLDRRNAELGIEDPPQMAARHADALGQMLDAAGVEHAVLDQVDGALREPRDRVDARIAGGELGPAAQARPVAFHLGGRGAREEVTVLAARQPHRADGPAVDARRRHADEEPSVEAGIVRPEGAVAGVGIERHGAIMPADPGADSPFSDVGSGNARRCRTCA